MKFFGSFLPICAFAVALCFGLSANVEAQQTARVERIQRTVEKQTGPQGAWADAGIGTTLVKGDRVRTGKRSKSDLRFSDKSLLRLGQLSSLEMRGAREARLLRGQLLFSALSPARILAGSATAAIKGTVPYIKLRRNGDVEFALYSGELEITSPSGAVTLHPGEWICVYADGHFSDKKTVSPISFINGELNQELLLPPRKELFAGSKTDIRLREDPIRQLFDSSLATLSPEAGDPYYNGFLCRTATPPTSQGEARINSTRVLRASVPSVAANATDVAPIEVTPGEVTPGEVTPLAPGEVASISAAPQLFSMALGSSPDATPTPMPDSPSTNLDTASTSATTTSSTGEEHLASVDPDLGSVYEFDARLLGAASAGDGGGSLVAGRFDASVAKRQTSLELAVTPLNLHLNGTDRTTALITQAQITHRTSNFDVILGRQHIWDGPIQASLFGSILRQGGRTTFDALRITSNQDKPLNLSATYLYDAYPNLLASPVPGPQRGLYGRAELREENFSLGLNVLHFLDAPNAATTGASVDFVLPLADDACEFYGEVGRDPFRRSSNAFGFTFPALSDATGVDLFLETADVGSATNVPSPGRELAARAYKSIGNHWNILLAANKFRGSETRFVVGFSLGEHYIHRDDVLDSFAGKQ